MSNNSDTVIIIVRPALFDVRESRQFLAALPNATCEQVAILENMYIIARSYVNMK